MTQRALGEALHVNQTAVAKLERRTDMYVSNLRAYIEAMASRLNSSPIYHYQVKGRLPGSHLAALRLVLTKLPVS